MTTGGKIVLMYVHHHAAAKLLGHREWLTAIDLACETANAGADIIALACYTKYLIGHRGHYIAEAAHLLATLILEESLCPSSLSV